MKGTNVHPNIPSLPPLHSLLLKIWHEWNIGMKKQRYPEANRRARFKKRNLGYLPLFDNPYPCYDVRSVDMHHVNGVICVPLPHRTHMLVKGRNSEAHKEHCKEWIEKLFLINVDTLLQP